jgi:uncharacterized membrane protein
VAIILACSAATVFGVADFVGGTASRRMHPLLVTLLAQLAGVAALLVLAWTNLGATGGAWHTGSLLWGLLAGVAGGIGMPMLYRALAIGPMNVVAPLVALTSAVVPVFFGLLFGERPSFLAWVGIVLAVIAGTVVGMSGTPADEGVALGAAAGEPLTAAPARPRTGVVLGLLSGFCFGAFYVLLARTNPVAGLWPVVSARGAGSVVAGIVLLIALLAMKSRSQAGPANLGWAGWRMAAVAGVLDASANGLYLLAAQRGQLAVVGSIMGLYPASTVLLARYLHGERIGPVQRIGLLLAVPAVVLIGGA